METDDAKTDRVGHGNLYRYKENRDPFGFGLAS